MSLPIKKTPKNPKKNFLGNKKGISVIIGYILLITAAIVISTIVYIWLKSYIPREPLECPDGASMFLKDYKYDCDNLLNITLKNNGRFDLGGYFIHGTDSPEQEVATIDLSNYTENGKNKGVVIFTGLQTNSLGPNEEVQNVFDLTETDFGPLFLIEIIPARFQESDGKIKLVSCGDSKIQEKMQCEEEECIPNCEDKECGDDGCGGSCGDCEELYGEGYFCSAGVCISEEECTDNCSSLGYECETWTICGEEVNCGTCEDGNCVDGVCIPTEMILLEDGFEDSDWDAKWDENGITDWSHATDRKKSGSYSAKNYGGFFIPGDNDLISDNLDASDANEIQISFWYNKDDLESDDFYIQIYDGNNYDLLQDLDTYSGPNNCAGSGGDDKWCKFESTITGSQYFKSNFRLKFEGTGTDYGENVWIDDVKIIKLL